MPVFEGKAIPGHARSQLETLGYEWLGEHGIAGRGFARRPLGNGPATKMHAHCFPAGHKAIERHLSFRDVLRANAALRAAYVSVKAAAAGRHPEGGAAYQAEKDGWIGKVLARLPTDP